MKKLLAISIVSLFLLTGAVAHAQTPSGSVPPGGACAADPDCQDANGQSYGCFNGICTLNGDAPATGASVAPTGATANGNFVPLTNLPTFQNIVGQPDLAAFFNSLYKICIGIAATLAVIQITIAGVMYMGGDSVTETKDAKRKIGQAVLGLVLVLSPVLVFGIINPSILSLKINFSGISTGAPATIAPDLTPTQKTAQQICGGYSSFKYAQIPAGKECSTPSVVGPGWVNLPDNVCCPGAAPAGGVCCGLDKNYTAPVPGQGPGAALSQYQFVLDYQTTDGLGKACVYRDTSGNFASVDACTTDYQHTLTTFKTAYAIERGCSETSSHSPTGSGAAALQKLPACPTN